MYKRVSKYVMILFLGFSVYFVPTFAVNYSSSSSYHRVYYKDNKPTYSTSISFYGGLGNLRAAITPHKSASSWLWDTRSNPGITSGIEMQFPNSINQINHGHARIDINTYKVTEVK